MTDVRYSNRDSTGTLPQYLKYIQSPFITTRFRSSSPTMAYDDTLQSLQRTVWQARIPLEIRLAASECRTFDGADPYLVSDDSPPLHDAIMLLWMADHIISLL